MHFTVELPHEPGSIPRARHEIERLGAVLDDATMRNTKLLVSELVTNVVRHVPSAEGTRIVLEVDQRDALLHVEVTDDGPGFEPRPRAERQDPTSGWGLHLMGRLAERWGVESGDGTRVWFELPVRAAEAS